MSGSPSPSFQRKPCGNVTMELIDLDESATRALHDAKTRFEDSRRKATEAFSNEALETFDRILAMQYRVMATILEKLDNPEGNRINTPEKETLQSFMITLHRTKFITPYLDWSYSKLSICLTRLSQMWFYFRLYHNYFSCIFNSHVPFFKSK